MRFVAAICLSLAAAAAVAAPPQQVEDNEVWKTFQAKLQLEANRRPAYSVTQTVVRTRREPAGQRFEEVDTIRVDIAVASGVKRFSWPGAGDFTSYSLVEMLAEPITEVGNLALVVYSLILSGEAEFTFAEKGALEGRTAWRYDYTLVAEESNFTMLINGNPLPVGHRGSIWIDPQFLRLLRIESKAAGLARETGITSMEEWIDFTSVDLEGTDNTLPSAGELVTTDNTGAGQRNQVRYENYRTNVPGLEAAASGRDELPEGVLPPLDLPAGLQVRIKLQDEIRFGEQAIGDPVSAIVVADAKKDKKVWLAKGTVLHGRIRALQRKDKPKIHYVLGFAWTRVEGEGQAGKIRAEVLGGGPFHGLIESERHWEVARQHSGGKEGRMKFERGLLYWDTVRLYVRKGLPMTIGVRDPLSR